MSKHFLVLLTAKNLINKKQQQQRMQQPLALAINDEELYQLIAQCNPTSTNVVPLSTTAVQIATQAQQQQRDMSISMRNARQRDYFVVQPRQEIYAEPHKYNIRLHGTDKIPTSSFTFELHVRTSSESEYVPYGIHVLKQIIVRGAPFDTIDVRAAFTVLSRAYNDATFFVQAKNEKSHVVCQTCDFLLVRKRRKRSKQEAS